MHKKGKAMKKINSIHYGGKILLFSGVIGILIPAILWLVNLGWNNPLVETLMRIALLAGLCIGCIFCIHLGIELHQDKKINQYYHVHSKMKILISDTEYECATCGNRQVHKSDTYCRMCGVVFETWENRTPQEVLDSDKRDQKRV